MLLDGLELALEVLVAGLLLFLLLPPQAATESDIAPASMQAISERPSARLFILIVTAS
jgi:hypothetical protein